MNRPAAILLSILLLAAGGCAINPPPATPLAEFCGFETYPITLPLTAATEADSPLATEIGSRLTRRTPGTAGQPYRLLALSGGSLHGAFGAGFLDGWRQSLPGERLPEFDVVTGISTGSILSTFAFLGDTERAVDRYSITNESELLTPIARSRPDGSMSPFELIRVVRRGAVADLGPLRNVLLVGDATHPPEISPAVMRAVAQAHDDGRTLMVGAVDLDTGQAVAFDLTDMASKYVGAGPAGGTGETSAQLRLRTCYVNAIIASSSAPLAAVPVFIDNSMYVDGGMRFGMFAQDVLQGAHLAEEATGRPIEYYVVANGDLDVDINCGREDPQACTNHPPTGQPTDPRSTWSLLSLAQRSENVLVNQVYRFSADRIIVEQKMGNNVWFARINRPALLAHRFRMDDAALDTLPVDPAHPDGSHTCSEWYDEDKARLHPVQFYPRYMHCLIDYGRGRFTGPSGPAGAWDIDPDPVPVAPGKPTP